MNVEQAKAVLKENGYFVDNLWTIGDVQWLFTCTDEQAQLVLERSLTNEATMEQIQFSIREFAQIDGLPKVIRDKKGNEVEICDSVEVGEPKEDDLHQHSFIGNIKAFRDDNIVVEDLDGNCFEVESDQIELTED